MWCVFTCRSTAKMLLQVCGKKGYSYDTFLLNRTKKVILTKTWSDVYCWCRSCCRCCTIANKYHKKKHHMLKRISQNVKPQNANYLHMVDISM